MRKLNRIYKVEEWTNNPESSLFGNDDRTWFIIAKNKASVIKMIMASGAVDREDISTIEIIGYTPI